MGVAAIIEIEEGYLTCTAATITRRSVTVGACVRVPFPECTAANLGNSLRLLREQVGELDRVWVLVGDRRILHSVVRVPPMLPDELRAFVRREALRQGGLSAGAELVAHARLSRPEGTMHRVSVCAAPAGVLEPIRRGCAEADVALLGVLSIENGIAGVLDQDLPERTAVIDFAGGKARFLVYERGQLTHMRRFLVHGVDSAAGMRDLFVAQLAMEVPRTLDYLREQDCDPPQCLLVSHSIAAGEDLLAMTEGQIPEVRTYQPTVRLAAGEDEPSLATLGLLQKLQRGRRLPLLTEDVALTLPPQPLRIAARAAAAVVGVAGLVVGMQQHGEARALRIERQGLEAAIDRSRNEIARRLQPVPMVETLDPEQAREQQILSRRRPISRCIARLCELVGPELHYDAIAFPDRHHLELHGGVAARNRLEALRVLGEFGEALGAVPFLERTGSEDLYDDPQGPASRSAPGWPAAGGTGANPTGTKPAGANQPVADPAGADPAGADPTGADPAGADPAGSDPAGADRAGTEPQDAGRSLMPPRAPGRPRSVPSGPGHMHFRFELRWRRP
ncbi:MAG: hypothetical protein AB7O97_18560 [Planctomycetota bacterium]